MRHPAFLALIIGLLTACSSNAAQQGSASSSDNNAPASQSAPAASAAAADDDAVITLQPGDTIAARPQLPTFVDFNATWCGPCRNFAPVFHEVAQEYKGKALFLSVDVDKCPQLAQKYGVQSIPHITLILPDGTVKSTVGYRDKDAFDALVKEALK
ncbi:MAG: thioredoxin fold domain-containing protein [Bacteroidales bacterium]|nr:thioredoxin fold domain-containing protein [Bacteroidales bacterium]